MNTYTVIVELQGSTYVAQLSAKRELDVIQLWCAHVAEDRPYGAMSKRIASAVAKCMDSPGLTPEFGVPNVWWFAAVYKTKLVLGHIVLTASSG
ncbi:hypothetical protein GCM10028811_20050 [Uliginosibacterium sediminicola]